MLRANVITLTGIIFNFEAEQTSIACVQAQVADVARRPLWMMPLLDRQNDAHAGQAVAESSACAERSYVRS